MIKSTWEQNLDHHLYQLNPDSKKLVRKLKKHHKIIKKNISVVFNQIY